MGVIKMYISGELFVCAAAAMLAALFAHVIVESRNAWRKGPGIVVRYIIGTLCIIASLFAWCRIEKRGDMHTFGALCVIAGAVGVATIMAHLYDNAREAGISEKENEALAQRWEEAMRERRGV